MHQEPKRARYNADIISIRQRRRKTVSMDVIAPSQQINKSMPKDIDTIQPQKSQPATLSPQPVSQPMTNKNKPTLLDLRKNPTLSGAPPTRPASFSAGNVATAVALPPDKTTITSSLAFPRKGEVLRKSSLVTTVINKHVNHTNVKVRSTRQSNELITVNPVTNHGSNLDLTPNSKKTNKSVDLHNDSKRQIKTPKSIVSAGKSPEYTDSKRRTSDNQITVDDDLLEQVSKKMTKPLHYQHSFKAPVMDHVAELRKRALWCMIALFIGGYFGYRFQDQIIAWLVKPLGQKLFYTSPTGGFDFLIKICLFFGFIVTVPVIIYNLFKFISPAIPPSISYSFSKITVMSILLAIGGVSFAYFVSLPAALHFLNNFSNDQISSLISAQEYFNFIMIYMAGFALLFQMPLVFSFINKVKPLKPARLLKQQRVVILISFVVAAILTPTPDPINQALMAAPIIALYQTSVGVVWHENKKAPRKSKKFKTRLKYA